MIDIKTLNRAIALAQKGYLEQAEKIYLNLLEKEPENSIVLTAAGLFYINTHEFEKAEIYLKQACDIEETATTVSALGFLEFERNEYSKAAEILEKALSLGESTGIYDKLIRSLFEIKDFRKAIDYSEKMYSRYPNAKESVINRVRALLQNGKLLEAQTLCADYLRNHHDTPALWCQLGYLKELIYGDDKQAYECYKIACDLGAKEAYYNIAVALHKMNDNVNAEKYFKKMLEVFPKDVDTLTSYGICLLSQKKFKEGYNYFYYRDKDIFKLVKNPWKPGDKIADNVAVLCDQGFGDHIQFIRYLPFIRAKVKNLYIVPHKLLKDLFKQNYPDYEFVDFESIKDNPEIQSMLVSDLPFVLDMDFNHIPFAEGYLNSPSENIQSDKLKVGLCWEAGGAGIRGMINRTINVKLLEPFFNLENVQIYSFQLRDTFKGNERYPQMINLSKNFKTFADTARFLKNMDLMLTVDTSVLHLAGALGIKTYLMLPYITDWRWFSDNKTTPWYNSVEIFKQTDPISWEKPIGDILCRLKKSSL